MAGANSKRIAASNARTLKQLQLGFLISAGIHLVHFALFTSGRTYRRVLLFAVTEAIAVGLWNQLKAMASNGTELDGSKGLVGYAFDVLYVTWFVHVATALISAQFWKLYWVIPIYALYRLGSFALPYISPSLAALVSGNGGANPLAAPGGGDAAAGAPGEEGLSKRQAKRKARAEKGDPRIQMRRG
ncbi:hypothetical protein JCM9279_001600 [Rhodotorula babjevae]